MKRTKITTDGLGRVTIEYTDADTGERVARDFTAPAEYGYVRETTGGDVRQVCERLRPTGSTLMAARADLAAVIRREYRRMRAQERRP